MTVRKDLLDSTAAATKSIRKTARKAKAKVTPQDVHGPSPNLATNLAIADIALRSGSALVRRAVEQTFLGKALGPKQAQKVLKGRTISESLLHGALARVAMRSVPGAIVVGGALVAKTLYDRAQAREAKRKGDETLATMAEKGED